MALLIPIVCLFVYFGNDSFYYKVISENDIFYNIKTFIVVFNVLIIPLLWFVYIGIYLLYNRKIFTLKRRIILLIIFFITIIINYL